MENLKEFLKKQAETPGDRIQEREAILHDWISAVERLIDRLIAWIHENDPDHILLIDKTTHQIREREIGEYEVKGLRLSLRRVKVVRVEPVARFSIGSYVGDSFGSSIRNGRVDMYNDTWRYKFYRKSESDDDGWLIVSEQDYQAKPLDRTSFEEAAPEIIEMTSLEEAWEWYTQTRTLLKILKRFAGHHWNGLPWGPQPAELRLAELGKDDMLNTLEGPPLVKIADFSLEHLDDQAIVLLFSVFESLVRETIALDVVEESKDLKHPLLKYAAEEATRDLHRGSFAKVLKSLKYSGHDLVEQIRQVRQYRNWVSHGKRGLAPFRLEPKVAYDRLSAFLRQIGGDSEV